MGDLTRFKNLEILEINNSNLVSLHPSIFSLTNLEVMVVRDNKLTEIPKEISNLRKLIFINLMGNKISNIPDSIKYLDKSNGGNLHRLAVSIRDIGEENYNKLKVLLPNVVVDPQ
jgi:Leucine-rich repeat (LRR) protein